MLSIEDLYREIGKNIFVYPLNSIRILGNSIDLTASRFAWTTDGKYIFNESTQMIVIPPHKTACILTQEAIYVNCNIGGTYHSRVSIAKKGLGHIGTMLDPEYIGQSLILLHNISDSEQIIMYKERIVSIVFYYLNTPILTRSHNSSPGHKEKLSSFENIDLYNAWCDQNRWVSEKRELVDLFLTSDDYRLFKEKIKTDQDRWNTPFRKLWSICKGYSKKYIVLLIICIILYLIINKVLVDIQVGDKINLISVLIASLLGCICSDITRG